MKNDQCEEIDSVGTVGRVARSRLESETEFVFTNEKNLQGPEVADHALALMLFFSRNLDLVSSQEMNVSIPRPIELRGKTALIYGCGDIGSLIAERVFSFGMRILAVNLDGVPYLRCLEEIYSPGALDQLLPKADAVFISAPLTAMTKHRFGDKQFNLMKDSAIVINVSRGGLLDTAALLRSVENGKFRGVGLDATEPEPLPEAHPLKRHDRVIISPHIAGMSDQNHERSFRSILDNIDRFLNNVPLANEVNVRRG